MGIAQTKYKKKNMTKKWLISNGFHHNGLLNDETEVYTYRFPVHKFNKFTTLECELQVSLGEDDILINVYDYATNNKYAPFYYCKYGNYDELLKEIDKQIDKVLRKMKVKGVEKE